MDVVSQDKRSQMMAGIRSRDTRPEIAVRRYLHAMGFRFRLQQRIGKVRPDIVLRKWKTCIFVHGCYWHRHRGCYLASTPKSNKKFWKDKFQSNIERDKQNMRALRQAGWSVGIIWECAVRNGSFADGRMAKLVKGRENWIIG